MTALSSQGFIGVFCQRQPTTRCLIGDAINYPPWCYCFNCWLYGKPFVSESVHELTSIRTSSTYSALIWEQNILPLPCDPNSGFKRATPSLGTLAGRTHPYIFYFKRGFRASRAVQTRSLGALITEKRSFRAEVQGCRPWAGDLA